MGRMPLRVREVKAMALKKGWVYSHTTGSHAHYYHPTIAGLLTIAGADHIELDKGAERKLRRQIQGK